MTTKYKHTEYEYVGLINSQIKETLKQRSEKQKPYDDELVKLSKEKSLIEKNFVENICKHPEKYLLEYPHWKYQDWRIGQDTPIRICINCGLTETEGYGFPPTNSFLDPKPEGFCKLGPQHDLRPNLAPIDYMELHNMATCTFFMGEYDWRRKV